MNTRLFLPILLWVEIILGSCTSSPQVPAGTFLVEGFLKNVPDSTVLELMKEDGGLLKTLCKDTVIDGRFSFRDSIAGTEPVKRLLLVFSQGFPGTWADVWLQSGKYVKITGQDCLHPLWEITSDIPEQQYTNDFMALCSAERRQSLQWMAQEYDYIRASRGKSPNWKAIDSLRMLHNPLDSLIYLAELNYMKQAPVTPVWLDKYKSYCSFLQWNKEFGHQDLICSLYARMSDAHKSTEAGREITAYINLPKIVGEGDEMVDGDLYDLDGNVRHLAEFKGKYILLDFWSQGCGPCVESLPEMEEVAELYKGKLEVVSISQDSKDSWKSFVAKRALKGNQWNELRSGNTGLSAAYQLKGIPHYVMISPEGKIKQVWSGYGKGLLKTKLQELLK